MDYIFDTHAHYDDEAFDADREEVLTGLKEQGIGTVVNVGASIASTKTTLALAEAHPFMYAAVGVHPDEVGELNGRSRNTGFRRSLRSQRRRDSR